MLNVNNADYVVYVLMSHGLFYRFLCYISGPGLTGLERHEGEQFMTEFSLYFICMLMLSVKCVLMSVKQWPCPMSPPCGPTD